MDAKEARVEMLHFLGFDGPPPLAPGSVTQLEKIDAYGDARELRGHVEACGKTFDERPGAFRCGFGWYCDTAPTPERIERGEAHD